MTSDSPTAQTRHRLTLQLAYTGSTPDVLVRNANADCAVRISAGQQCPTLPTPDATVSEIEALDVLEHVFDEECWLAELARVAAPGATLHLRLPSAGLLAWLDSLNAYRYMTDTLGRGRDPREALPTGWHRHYQPHEVRKLLLNAGFQPRTIERRGIGLAEPLHFAGLVAGDFAGKDRDTEARLLPLRRVLDTVDARFAVPYIGTRLVATAVRR